MKKRISVFLFFLFALVLPFFTKAQSDSAHFLVSYDGAKIYYEVKGEGFPVLLLHGFTGTGQSWKRGMLYNDLINSGYKVITPDLRGNGRSDKPQNDSAYANDAEARDMMALVSTLGINKYYVVGYSRGSIITARLLVLDKRVSKAVMGGMGTDFTNPEWPRRVMFYHLLSGDTTIKGMDGFLQYVKQNGFDKNVLALQQKYQPSTPKEELEKVQLPVLVVCGNEDTDNGNAQELTKLFLHGSFVQVPGDHNHAAQTKEFSDAVLSSFKQ